MVSNFGEALPCALGVNLLTFMPGYAAAWMMRSLSVSKPLFSALASALVRTLRMRSEAFIGYLPAKALTRPLRWPAFLLYLRKGTAFFFSMTSRRYSLAWVSIMPLIVRHISRECLWDTLSSLPLALTVFSGSSSSAMMEYPHFGNVFHLCAIEQRKSDLYGFPYQGYFFDKIS